MSGKGPIVVTGFKGCGKSKIGKALAGRLGLDFFDTDTMIEEMHRERTQQDLDFRGIYTEHGSEYFESLEIEVLKRSSVKKTACVISFGGGSLIKADEAGLLMENAVFVYITVEDDLLFDRIIANGIPAFFDKENPRGSFDRLMLERTPVYEKYADITVDNTGRPADKVVDEIVERLKAKG
ncbi:hypothetical protein MNBD_NITROSPINAE04-1988 [hydrothermal vent metagenome]|uniref:Shikimate kinase n=1 Tax=hydrothermal vent metagenome TaxID=652676 RepID=A0A3B1BWA2_9ZZZZ